MAFIPHIDITNAIATGGVQELGKRLFEAYSNFGFAYLVNHGIPQTLVDEMFYQSRQFHSLPEKQKMMLSQNEFFRGYLPLEKSQLSVSSIERASKPNKSAAFIVLHDVDETDQDYLDGVNLAGPNQWPSEEWLPEFKDVLLEYREAATQLVIQLIKAFSSVLTGSTETFDRYTVNPTTYLRLQYYPNQEPQELGDQYGIAPHTDYGLLTLLLQDNQGGLQVWSDEHQWVDVSPIEGGIVLNTADMLRYISGNQIISTKHRVINTSGCARYSIPFFYEPGMHTKIESLKSDTEKPPYAPDETPFEYYKYAMLRVHQNYDIGAKSSLTSIQKRNTQL